LVLVVEDEHGVGGFVLGTPDTATWVRRLEEEWWPSLRLVYDDPRLAPAPSWSADQKRASMIHRPSQAITSIIERYPAHVHLNLAPRLQGQGLAHQLFAEWMKTASGRGVAAIHLGANPDNHRAISFWLRQGFRALNPDEPSPRVVWMGRL
jgi:ribosomal protein S18 acetylase RimI-like enzyme